jgi:DNA-binding XRE family transcriptional regulator
MDKTELVRIRKFLAKTQNQLAAILGISVKTIRSYEQGTRGIPAYIERQLLFILSQRQETLRTAGKCWEIMNCSMNRRSNCPAWEFNCGAICWFINGTICQCAEMESWEEKMYLCRECEVLQSMLAGSGLFEAD